ncbi:HTR3C, partial [Cervus elaphus hippelaphus]
FLLATGRGNIFTINCSGFDQHGVDPAAFQALFELKVFCPATNISISTHISISFICLPSWKCSVDVDQVPPGLTTYVSSQGQIIVPQANEELHAHLQFPPLHRGEWGFLNTSKATPKMLMDSNLYDQSISYVANRCRPSLFILNLLVSSSFLVTIDALSFYLTAGNKNLASFKITLLLGYNVLLLMIKDLLPAIWPLQLLRRDGWEGLAELAQGREIYWAKEAVLPRVGLKERNEVLAGRPSFPPGVYFALCLSLMVLSLLETIFISYRCTWPHLAMPRWLHFLLLHCTSQRTCCPAVPQKGNTGLDHLPGVKEPMEFVGKMPGPREKAKWVPSVSKDLAGKQDSEAALGQPVGAVKPHDGHPVLLSLPALHGHPITTVIVL